MKHIPIILSFLLIFLILSSPILAEDFDREARINFRGITGDDFIGQAGLLYPFRNKEDSLWYSDVRYRLSSDDIDEWNLGLGYRRKIDTAENHIAGIYVFRDRRKEYEHYWDMWTIGGEILTDKWDFRLNGYISDNDKVLAPESSVGNGGLDVNENQELILTLANEVYYKSMDGLDVELGKRFTETDSIFKNVGVYGRLFRFFESDTPTITGRQIRIDKQFGDINNTTWKLGAMWRDDNVRDSKTELTFAVSIPFGRDTTPEVEKVETTSADILEARMTEQPERDLDIVVGKAVIENGSAGEVMIIDNPVLGGESIKVWYVTEDGDYFASGSEDDPINIHGLFVEGKAQAGDIIVLNGAGGDIYLDFAGSNNIGVRGVPPIYKIELKDYQQLISANGHATVITEIANEEREFKFTPNVEQATLVGSSDYRSGMILPSKNNVISGINFINDSNRSVLTINGNALDSGYLNINNNTFEFSADNICACNWCADPIINLESSSNGSQEFNFNIVDNKFHNETTDNEVYTGYGAEFTAVRISSNNINDRITISGNKIYGSELYDPQNTSAIDIANLYTTDIGDENFIFINDNTIDNYDIGIWFGYSHIDINELDNIKEYYEKANTFNDVHQDKVVIN